MDSVKQRAFGSFHTSNVEELLTQPEDVYIPPTIPVKHPDFNELQSTEFSFGKLARQRHFFLEEECIFINHGAFGSTMKEVLDAAQEWQRYIEKQPLRFFDRELFPHLVFVTRRLSKFVGCSCSDLVLIENATTAVNTVLRSQHFNSGDVIFCLDNEYGAVKKMIEKVSQDTGSVIQMEHVDFPIISSQQIIDLVDKKLKPGTKLAVFDHIPSNTPFIMPVAEIVKICHSRNVPVLVDGAHALGQLDLNIADLGVDYYVSNAHKWFLSAKGAAFLYVDKKHQSSTRPLVISHGFGSGFSSEFIWAGLRDYSPFFSLHTALDFWEAVQPAKLREYMWNLASRAADYLVEKWRSKLLVSKELSGCMVCVQLPQALYEECEAVNYDKAEIIQNELFHRFSIEVPVKAIQNHLYVRISAHVYNTMEEYQFLAESVITMSKKCRH